MPYPIGTTLKRSEPLEDIAVDKPTYDKEGTQTGTVPATAPHPHNHLKIVGPSPIKSASVAEWAGEAGDHWIVTPVDEFGANEIIPEAILNRDYDVAEFGDDVLAAREERIILDQRRGSLAHAESPEQAFAKAAKAEKTAAAKRTAKVASA